jgi:hypothetical protein
VCVRKAEPREEVVQYARLNHIDVVPKMNLVVGLRNLLDPGRPADADQLADLASRFSKP